MMTGTMCSAVCGRGMPYYLIIFCLVLLITPAVTGMEAPAVTGITPANGVNSTTLAITNLAGTNFTAGATVILTPDPVKPVHTGSLLNGGGALLSNPRSVFVAGNYAYVTSVGSNALEIVDVTNPAAPVHKSSISHGEGGALLLNPQSVFVAGNYAYVASYDSNALEIVDVTDPAAPVHTGSISDGGGSGAPFLNKPYSVYVAGNYAYVASYGSNELEIVDVTNRANPVHKGYIFISAPRSVYVSGTYAYVASAGSDALVIVNVTNPADPNIAGSISNGGGALLNDPYSVYISGNNAYVASYSSNALEIVDVTNPAAPVHKGSISNPPLTANPQSVYVSGNYAYLASSSNTLVIVDVTNPAVPIQKGYIQDGGSVAPFLDNPSSVYVSGNYIYVASFGSNSNALEIVDIGTVTATAVNVVSAHQITGMLNLNSKIAGLYNVVVTNPDGKFGTLSRGFTVLAAGAPAASFTGTPASGTSPLTVSFTDSSTQPSSWNWSFGEGNFSTLQNPVHTYYRGGAYTVSLTVTNAKGTDTLTRIDYIIVNGDKIGIFRNSTGYWKLDYNNTGAVSKSFRYGTTKDIPLAGDWNGDGTSDAAVFRPSNGNWYVNYFKDTITDKTFHFGMTGDIPVVGDWDGNGISDAGVFRPSVGNWYMDTTKTGVVNKTFHFGMAGDIPVVGDWDGNGISDAGVFRPSVGNWYMDTTKTGVVNKKFHFGMAGDIPVVGDWDGNGISDAGVFRPSVGNWYMDTTKTGVVNKTFHFGIKGDTPVVGDWDGNGTSDAAVFRPSNGYWYMDTTKTGVANKVFHFGKSGDSPIAGKWSTGNTRVAPVAAFVANITSGRSPLTVKFTDRSPGCPTSWYWSFGDGTTSILQNPAHTYTSNKKTQSYTVTLTVTNLVGSNTKTITGYITVVK